MLEGPLRLAAIILSGVVLLSFALFVIDEASGATRQTTADIADRPVAGPSPTPREERLREQRHTRAREAVDDADDVLLAPFAWAAPRDAGAWVRHGLPAALGLLAYGLGLGYLARFTRGIA